MPVSACSEVDLRKSSTIPSRHLSWNVILRPPKRLAERAYDRNRKKRKDRGLLGSARIETINIGEIRGSSTNSADALQFLRREQIGVLRCNRNVMRDPLRQGRNRQKRIHPNRPGKNRSIRH